jgi:hypothetical protein
LSEMYGILVGSAKKVEAKAKEAGKEVEKAVA